MYPEFIAIYVGLGVLALLLIVTIVLLIVVLCKLKNGTGQRTFSPSPKSMGASYGNGMGVVFCNNCGTQFDGATKVCPRCGTTR